MRGAVCSPVLVLCLAVVSACSGAAPSDLLASTYSGTTTEGGVDASVDSGNHDPGGHDASSGGQTDATTIHDSGDVQDVVSVPETGVVETGGGGGGDVNCGSSTCAAPQQFCCVTGAGPGGNPSYKCQSGQGNCGGSANPGTPVYCDKTADCPGGDVCCGAEYNGAGGAYYSDVSCQATCNGTGSNPMQVQFCDPNGNDCPQGMTGQMSQVLIGYSVCR
jgi:hypothetical protein